MMARLNGQHFGSRYISNFYDESVEKRFKITGIPSRESDELPTSSGRSFGTS
jgi:hypothetical protein